MAAASAGHTVISMDSYADTDTAAVSAGAIRLSASDPEESLHSLRQAYPNCRRYRVIAGGGLEADGHLMRSLCAENDWCGARPDARHELDDPVKLHGMLRSINVPMPHTSSAPPGAAAAGSAWLRKPRHSSGGIGIKKYTKNNIFNDNINVNNNYCWQEYLPGDSCSALFLASGGEVQILGYSRHLRSPTDDNFHYQGAVSIRPLPGWREQLRQYVRPVALEYGLVGLAGVDFIADHADRRRISVVEINPRPTATMSLHCRPGHLIRLHLAACQGLVPDCDEETGLSRGEMVYYSPAWMRANIAPARWPAWVRDRPAPGSVFKPGDPVCTVQARGASANGVELELRRRLGCLSVFVEHNFKRMVHNHEQEHPRP